MTQKRKSNGWEPPTKRPHSENDFSRQDYQQGTEESNSLPTLPPITQKYEKPVFTHQSTLTAKDSGENFKSYERLEFLGDAYIEVMASRLIFEKHKSLPAGRMSQIRELLVKNDTLAQYSTMYGFDKKLRVNQDVYRGNPRAWTKIKGDLFEAYVAAIVLSDPVNGFDVAEKWLTELWKPKLSDVRNADQPKTMEKTRLAKVVGGKDIRVDYVDEKPPVQHKQLGQATYFVGVYLTGWGWENQHLGSGKGLSKVDAGHEAASKALENHPLIDQIITKREAFFAARAAGKEYVKPVDS